MGKTARLGWLVGLSAAWLGSPALAQDFDRDQNSIVEFKPGTGQSLSPTDLPVPFGVPKPGTGSYRSLEQLTTVLTDEGAAKICIPSVLGSSQPGGAIPAQDIRQIRVTTSRATRPDGSAKGRALIVSGLHAREWMAIEGVVAKVERDFQSGGFKDALIAYESGNAAGTRAVFFADNLIMVFAPVMNPGGLLVTQGNHAACYRMMSAGLSRQNADPSLGVMKGSLRDGRMRRKSLPGTDGDLATPGDALEGIDLNRNFPSSNGSEEEWALTYRGDPGAPESECQAVTRAITDAGLMQPDRLTGAAILDVHAPLGNVSFSGTSREDSYFREYADAVSRAAYGTGTAAVGDPLNLGTLEHYGRSTCAIPTATFELPEDASIQTIFRQVGKGPVFEVEGRPFDAPTVADLRFLVGPVFADQVKYTSRAIDAALTCAAGPPYLAQVLFLQEKDKQPGYDRNATAEAEVIYDARWTKKLDWVRRLEHLSTGERWLNLQSDWKIVLVFSKPMRADKFGEKPDEVCLARPGLPSQRQADILIDLLDGGLLAEGHWESDLGADGPRRRKETADVIEEVNAFRYQYDTWVGRLTPPPGLTIKARPAETEPVAALYVRAADEAALPLDGTPVTVAAWSAAGGGSFTSYDESFPDASHALFSIDTVHPRLRHLSPKGKPK